LASFENERLPRGLVTLRYPSECRPLVSYPATDDSIPTLVAPGLSHLTTPATTPITCIVRLFLPGQVWFDTHFTTAGSFSRAMPIATPRWLSP
jgi:hypothetical protein